MALEVREVPELPGVEVLRRDSFAHVFAALGVVDRGQFYPRLLPGVLPVAIVAVPPSDQGGDPAFCWNTTLAGGPGTINHFQLFNPSSSGRLVLLDELWIKTQTAAADPLYFWSHDAQLAVLQGRGVNKRLGEALGAAEVRNQNAALIPGGVPFLALNISNTALEFTPVVFNRPIELMPGRGLVVTPNPNTQVNWNAHWRERAI